MSQMLVELAIESGMRWGELAELRLKDVDLRNRIVTISRTVVEVMPQFHPDGGRFLIKEYPKDREWRRFRLSKERLGHGSIATTERYLHTLPDADDTAVDAFAKIRHRSTG